MQCATKSTRAGLNARDAHRASAWAEQRRERELQGEAVVSVFCVTVLLSIALGAVVGYGLARALLSTAPVTLSGDAP